MKIKTEIFQSTFIITCEGPSLDSSLALGFLTAMTDFIKKSQLDIILDLSAVNFVNSTELGSVVRSLDQSHGTGKLILCGVDERVLSLLKMTQMDEIFVHTENRQTSLSHLFWERKKATTTPASDAPKRHVTQDKNSEREVTEIQEPVEEQAILWQVDEEDLEELEVEGDREEKEIPDPGKTTDRNSETAPVEERRRYRRLEHHQIMNDEFIIYCENITSGRHHPAIVLNISAGGLLMTSPSQLSVGDELLIEGRIGKNFTFKERAVSRSCRQQNHGLEFIDLSAETTSFLEQLTGSVAMMQANKFRHT
jgi:anti-sigma B factor antagonist